MLDWFAGVCSGVDPVRYSGDLWNVSACEYCVCINGKVQCHKAACEKTVCLKVKLLHLFTVFVLTV